MRKKCAFSGMMRKLQLFPDIHTRVSGQDSRRKTYRPVVYSIWSEG